MSGTLLPALLLHALLLLLSAAGRFASLPPPLLLDGPPNAPHRLVFLGDMVPLAPSPMNPMLSNFLRLSFSALRTRSSQGDAPAAEPVYLVKLLLALLAWRQPALNLCLFERRHLVELLTPLVRRAGLIDRVVPLFSSHLVKRLVKLRGLIALLLATLLLATLLLAALLLAALLLAALLLAALLLAACCWPPCCWPPCCWSPCCWPC